MNNGIHTFEFRVYYADTDAGGVVYHSRYLEFYERARYEFFLDRGISIVDLANEGFLFPVKSVSIEYRHPAVLGELLVAETEIDRIGRASVHFKQRIRRRSDGRILSEVQVTCVCVDRQLVPIRIPGRLRREPGKG